ncbi:hypothetical protein [Nocardia sp. NPDC003979]
MNLPSVVIALVFGMVVLFAIVCGLGASIMIKANGDSGMTAALGGFAATNAALLIGFTEMFTLAAVV